MPSQTLGFDKNGNSQWFNSGRLPAGWSPSDPSIKKESTPAPVVKRPSAKDKVKEAQDKADKERKEAVAAQKVADKERKEAVKAQDKAFEVAKKSEK